MRRKNKKLIFIIILVVVIVWIVYAFNTDYINIPNTGYNSNYCKNNIIPDTITFTDSMLPNTWNICLIKSNWKDGTKITYDSMLQCLNSCHLGNSAGENVNSVYCNGLKYSNTPVDNNGNIGVARNYKIDLVFSNKPKINSTIIEGSVGKYQENSMGYNIISYKCEKI